MAYDERAETGHSETDALRYMCMLDWAYHQWHRGGFLGEQEVIVKERANGESHAWVSQ